MYTKNIFSEQLNIRICSKQRNAEGLVLSFFKYRGSSSWQKIQKQQGFFVKVELLMMPVVGGSGGVRYYWQYA